MAENWEPKRKMSPTEREKKIKDNMEKAILIAREEKRDQCGRLDILLDSMKDMKRGVRGKVEDSEDRIARFVEEMKIEIMMRDERKDQEIRDEIDELKENLSETRDHFNQEIGSCKNELHRVDTHLNSLRYEFDETKKDFEIRIKWLETWQPDAERRLSSMEVWRPDAINTFSPQGELIWKIDNYFQKKELERTGEHQGGWISPVFFSHKWGYRMQCQVYLNGMGEAQGEYASIFYFITPGPYDDLNQFPFQRRVIFSLLPRDHKETNPIRRLSVVPSTKGSAPISYDMGWISVNNAEKFPECFDKPTQGRNNEPYGQPEFARITDVETEKFLRDDCVYFRVVTEDIGLKPDYLEFNKMGFLHEGETHPLDKLPLPSSTSRKSSGAGLAITSGLSGSSLGLDRKYSAY